MTPATPHEPERGAPRLRSLQKDFTRKHLLSCALAVFDEKGYTATTMEDIAKAAGMNRGTIYLHFSNKAELLLETLPKLEVVKPGFQALGEVRSRDGLQEIFEATYDFWEQRASRALRHVYESAAAEPDIREWKLDYDDGRREELARAFERQGLNEADAHQGAFIVYAVWTETIRQMGAGTLKMSRAEVVLLLIDSFDLVRNRSLSG